jgi:MtN3 and saliva related transmembrane protein
MQFMELTLTDWLGYAAAVLTTFSFVPQALLTVRSRDVSGISLSMYSAFTAGIALWLVYGWQLGAWPIIVANTLTLILAGIILFTKVRVELQGEKKPPVF